MGARQTGELEGLVDQSETGGLSLGDTLNLSLGLDFLVRLLAALASLQEGGLLQGLWQGGALCLRKAAGEEAH